MLPEYTIYDLGMNVCGKKFILPFDKEKEEKEVVDKTLDLILDCIILYEKQPISIAGFARSDIENKYITIPCLYEGYDRQYPYDIVLEVFRIKYDSDQRIYFKDDKEKEVKNGQWMVAMCTENSEGELLQELIDINVIPKIIERMNLGEYTYKF